MTTSIHELETKEGRLNGSQLTLPGGLWKLKQYPYLSQVSHIRGLPWGTKEQIEDSIRHHDVLKEIAGIEIVAIISKGTFSSYFKGYWKKYDLPVALKVYDKRTIGQPPSIVSDRIKALKNLPIETEVLRRTKHPHIISCFGTWETEFRIYLAFELLTETLLSYIRRHGVARESQAKTWFAQSLSAIVYLHNLNIAHRDIKLENFVIDLNLNLRLTDFGFCALNVPWDASIPNSNWKKSTDFCGSEAYLSPEIILRIPYSPLLSDVWALGVVLYGTLFGCFPFDTTSIEIDPKDYPTSWMIPEEIKVSSNCISVLKRMFLLERLRVRSYELIQLDWFDEQCQFDSITLAENAHKTVREVMEENERYGMMRFRKSTQIDIGEITWGQPHHDPPKSQLNCTPVSPKDSDALYI